MAIDLKKMQEKLNRAEGKNTSVFWKPQDGEQTIRILSGPDGDPFKEFWFHYNLGQNPGFLSPKRNYGEDDKLNDFVRSLFDSGTEDDRKLAKQLMARQRFFSAVIVRGEEEKGVRLWGYGKMAYKALLELVLNPDYDDITDPETGTDLVIKYGKPPGAQFPQTGITPKRRTSPLFPKDKNGSQAREALEAIPDFQEVFADKRKTPEEDEHMLDQWFAAETAQEMPDVEQYGSTSTASDVDQKVKELMSQGT